MAPIIVCGGGVIGLSTAMMLARDGHEVTVLEADPELPPPTPELAWEGWRRKGVAQFRQPHNLFARFRKVCDEELPELTDNLLAAGCVWVDYLATPPPTLVNGQRRAGDEVLRFVTGRRPVVEAVFAAGAAREPGVCLRRGTRVDGLLAGPAVVRGVPHVAGVRTASGEELRADLVIDATGRRAPAPRWLTALGARPPETQAEDCGFVYYTRYYTGPTRPRRIAGALSPIGSISLLTLDGDNDTWSVTIFGASGDTPLKRLRDPAVFTRLVAACPLHAHWIDGRSITDVLAMAGILDCYRRYVVDGQPRVTGYAAVGDAWACTNPSAGRGLSVGIVHAQLLRQVVHAHLDDPATFAYAWDEHTERVVAPFYRSQVRADRARIAEMDALRGGRPAPEPDPARTRFLAAASRDMDVYRGFIETVLCLALPEEVLARPGIAEKIAHYGEVPPPPVPGPDRAELMALLAD